MTATERISTWLCSFPKHSNLFGLPATAHMCTVWFSLTVHLKPDKPAVQYPLSTQTELPGEESHIFSMKLFSLKGEYWRDQGHLFVSVQRRVAQCVIYLTSYRP